MSERALRLVDRETGELHACPDCQRLEDEVAGLQRDVRGWAHRYRELKRDKEREARGSSLWPVALEHFDYWKEKTGRRGCSWNFERFELILPFLKNPKYRDWIRCAIDGQCFDPFVTVRKNGTQKVHNDWELLFRNAAKFEEAVRKAPLESRPKLSSPAEENSTATTSDGQLPV